MLSLRDCWRRSWLHQYFAAMDPMDRATALIVLALSSAIAVCFAAYVSYREPSLEDIRGLAPGITAPPFELAFA